MLAFSNQELLIRNGVSLEQLARAAATDNKVLAVMTDKTQKDSRTMRIATIVAMFYLPVNLVVVLDPFVSPLPHFKLILSISVADSGQ